MAWHRESRRHSLASKGVKTAINPVNRVSEFTGPTGKTMIREVKPDGKIAIYPKEMQKKQINRLMEDAMGEWSEERNFDRQKQIIEELKELGVSKKEYLDKLDENNHYMLGEWVEENWDTYYQVVPNK